MLFKLHTNEGTTFVRASRQSMWATMGLYVRRKRAAGVPFSQIIYCFTPVRAVRAGR